MRTARRMGWLTLVLVAAALGCRGAAPVASDPCSPDPGGQGGFGFTSGGLGGFADGDGDTFFTDRSPAAAATTAAWGGGGKSCGASAGRDNSPAGDTSGINIQDFVGQEINLVPSNYTPPEDTGVDIRGLGDGSAGVGSGFDPTVRRFGDRRAGDDVTDEDRPLFGTEAEDYEIEIAQAAVIVRKGTSKIPRTWQRSSLVPNTARLKVGDDDELPLEAMDISVRIEGFRARVVLDCFFRNDREQQLAGTFQLRLPSGASPHYLAFGRTQLERPAFTPNVPAGLADIRESRTTTWEAPKEARLVPREQAAFAYTDTVRQKIDPALMEWTGTGVFDARVFPLEPGAVHHIAIAYDTDLARLGSRLVHRVPLPERVPDLDVEISSADATLKVAPAGTRREGRLRWHNPRARALVAVLERPGPVLLTGRKPGAGAHFAARFRPALPETPAAAKSKALFLVDTSLSANPDRLNTWLALMKQILERNRPGLREFAVAFFNVETSWWDFGLHPNTPENTAAVMRHARTLALEGATDLGQALDAARALADGADVFLLSDGAITWGEGDLHALMQRAPSGSAIFAYAAAGAGTNLRVLQHLGRESGGAVFQVASDAQIARVAVAHRKRPWRLEGVSLAGTNDLLLAGRPTTLFPGQELLLAGRGTPTDGASIELHVAQGTTRRVVRVAPGRATPSIFTGRIYGQVAVEQLEALGEATSDEARAYATQFRVVGRSCSLLMLETEEDYERYGIKPLDDLALIQERPAATVVRDALRAHGDSLRDPKRRLLARLDRLAKVEVLQMKLPDDLRKAFEALPVQAFRVPVPPLQVTARRGDEIPQGMRTALAERRFTYDSMTAEADRRKRLHGSADGLKALSSLVEQNPADLVLLRDVAATAIGWGLNGQAWSLLSKVTERRPYELPTYVALGRCLVEMGKVELALLHYELALNAGGATGDFKRIVSFEYARLLRRDPASLPAFARRRLDEIAAKLPEKGADLVVVMEWNTDRSDVDLHVTDPAGEECFYSHAQTEAGGTLTQDVTTGFGPEMFVLEEAPPGDYKIDAVYYSSDALRTLSRSKVTITIYEDWGRPAERVRQRTATLARSKDRQAIEIVRR